MWTLGVVGMEEEIGVDEYHRRAVPSSTSSRPPMSSMLPGLSRPVVCNDESKELLFHCIRPSRSCLCSRN